MARYLVVSIIAVCALALLGCNVTSLTRSVSINVGSGRLVEREFSYDDFNRVELGHTAEFEITQSSGYSILVSINDNFVDRLQVETRGQTLHIGMEGGSYNNLKLKVRITMPALAGLEASGAARGTISGFSSSDPFDVNVSGASRLEGDIDCGDLQVEASGASQVSLRGAGGKARLNVSGASKALLGDFQVGDADVEASGASQAELDISGQLNTKLSGASHLRYSGNPTGVLSDTSGASSLRPR